MDLLAAFSDGRDIPVAEVLGRTSRLDAHIKRQDLSFSRGRVRLAYQTSTRFEIGAYQEISADEEQGFILREGYALKATADAVREACLAGSPDQIADRLQRIISTAFGEFSFIVYFGAHAYCVQSIGGTRPFFYRVANGTVMVSNRTSPLADIAFGKPSLDYFGMSEVIAFDSLISDRTAFNGVERLPPGAVLIIEMRPGAPHHRIYTPSEMLAEADAPGSFEDLMRQAEPVIESVVSDLQQFGSEVDLGGLKSFALSGGKDSRVLALILRRAGLMDRYEAAATMGFAGRGEALAAQMFAQKAGIRHVVNPPPGAGGDNHAGFIGKLGAHLFQMEGEISPRILHGNSDVQQANITGHEAGLRDAFPTTKHIQTWEDVQNFILAEFRNVNVDPMRALRRLPMAQVMARFSDKIAEARSFGVRPENFAQWLSIVGRGTRWVGRLAGQSAAHGFYLNPLYHPRIVKFAHNAGLEARRAEIFHSAVLYTLGREFLDVPFCGQELSKPFQTFLNARGLDFAQPTPLGQSYNQTLWWNQLYARDNRRFIRSLIYAVRTPDMDEAINFEAVDRFIDTTSVPNARAALQIFSIVGTGVISRHGGIDRKIEETAAKAIAEGAASPDQKASTPKSYFVFRGRIDVREKERVAGWVQEVSTLRPVTLEVLYEGKVIAEGGQTALRADVMRAVGGLDRCGFDIPVPQVNDPSKLSVRVKGYSHRLA